MNPLSQFAERHLTLPRAGALVAAVIPLAVYVLTLQNGLTPGELQGGDPITHQYAQATLRFANAPGYPIFTLLGWVWFQLSALLTPFFNPIERLAFYSTLYAIPSLVLLYYLLLEVQIPNLKPQIPSSAEPLAVISQQSAISRRSSAAPPRPDGVVGRTAPPRRGRPSSIHFAFAILATLFFASTYFFWYYAVSSENYSSGVLIMLLMIALAWRWQERRDERTLLWLSFVCGLSLAHLLTVALAVPAIMVFVVGQQMGYLRKPKLIAKTIIAAFLPLLSYAYIYWRGAEHPEWRGQGNWPTTLAWFIDFMKTQQGQHELTWSWDGVPWPMLQLITNELTLIVFVGGLIGLVLLPRWRAVLLLGIAAIYAPELYVDRYGNWFQTIIVLYPVFIMGFVALLYRTYVLAAKRISPHLVGGFLALLMGVLFLNRLAGNYAADNLRDRPTATGLRPGWQLLADGPERGAQIAGSYEENLALDYLTQVWGARPDVKTLAVSKVNSQLGQVVYASRTVMPIVMQALPPTAHLTSEGLSLIGLRTVALTSVPHAVLTDPQPAKHGLQLAGFQSRRLGAQRQVTLYWRAAQSIDVDMSISVRLIRGTEIVAQADSAQPVDGYFPMTRWASGEVVRDDYALNAAEDATVDRIHVIAYRKTDTGFENLMEFDFTP